MAASRLPSLVLKPGRERAVRHRHPWIFSGAIAEIPRLEPGGVARVLTASGELLGICYVNRACSLTARMLAFEEIAPEDAVQRALAAALERRVTTLPPQTTGYRLVHGESDNLPGLIIDRYDDVLVLQVATAGMERLKDVVIDWLQTELSPQAIVERSESSSRKEEGLSPVCEVIRGRCEDEVHFTEYGLRFIARPKDGQKTGFFLDQREMRALIRTVSADRRVLNCFSYSGAFSVYALAGGATEVCSIDIGGSACALAENTIARNGFTARQSRVVEADVFDFLRTLPRPAPYDLIILDPPAFAKRRDHVKKALRGYRDINRVALSLLPPRGLLLTCSCSYHVSKDLFEEAVFHAAGDVGRHVRVLDRHRIAADHAPSIFHRESEYLKSLLLQVD